MADEHEPPKEAKKEHDEKKDEKKEEEHESAMEKALTSVLEPLVGAFEKMSAEIASIKSNMVSKSEFPLGHVNANAGGAEAAPKAAAKTLEVDTVPSPDTAVKPGANTEDVNGTFAQKGHAGGISKADLEALLETHSKNLLAKAVETVKASTPAPASYADQIKMIRKTWQGGVEDMIIKALTEERQIVGFNAFEDNGAGGWKAATGEKAQRIDMSLRKMLGDEVEA